MGTALWVIAVTLAFIAGRFADGYWRTKGQNAATKDDIAEITRLVEQAKAESAHELEAVKAAISSRLGVSQHRYQREFEMLLGLAERVVAFRDAATGLRPEAGYGPGDDEPEERERRQTRFAEAAQALYRYFEPRRPFLDPDLQPDLQALDVAALTEFIQYRHHRQETDPKYWERARENAAAINLACNVVLGAIGRRARDWERLDLP